MVVLRSNSRTPTQKPTRSPHHSTAHPGAEARSLPLAPSNKPLNPFSGQLGVSNLFSGQPGGSIPPSAQPNERSAQPNGRSANSVLTTPRKGAQPSTSLTNMFGSSTSSTGSNPAPNMFSGRPPVLFAPPNSGAPFAGNNSGGAGQAQGGLFAFGKSPVEGAPGTKEVAFARPAYETGLKEVTQSQFTRDSPVGGSFLSGGSSRDSTVAASSRTSFGFGQNQSREVKPASRNDLQGKEI